MFCLGGEVEQCGTLVKVVKDIKKRRQGQIGMKEAGSDEMLE